MPFPATHHEFFIIRLHAEAEVIDDVTRWVWRGQVEHSLSGQLWRFSALSDLPKILETCLLQLLNGRDE